MAEEVAHLKWLTIRAERLKVWVGLTQIDTGGISHLMYRPFDRTAPCVAMTHQDDTAFCTSTPLLLGYAGHP